MKNLIRRILKEDANIKVLKKYITRDLQKQVDSGEVPMLDFIDLVRKKLSENYFNEIKQIYFDFVGGEEEAFKLFKKYIEGKIITDEDIRNIGRKVLPEDQYKIEIIRIYNPDYSGNRIIGNNQELEFVFELLNGQFATSEGILTLHMLYDEEYDNIWGEVTDHMKYELEDYVLSISKNFGLEFDVCTSHLH